MVRDVQTLSLHTWLFMVHILSQARVFTRDAELWIRDCARVGIVSRECRMPSVVGTAVLKDGMRLTVDGSRGVVRIDSRVSGHRGRQHHIRWASVFRRMISHGNGGIGHQACSTVSHDGPGMSGGTSCQPWHRRGIMLWHRAGAATASL
jgi:hypothetical protein